MRYLYVQVCVRAASLWVFQRHAVSSGLLGRQSQRSFGSWLAELRQEAVVKLTQDSQEQRCSQMTTEGSDELFYSFKLPMSYAHEAQACVRSPL